MPDPAFIIPDSQITGWIKTLPAELNIVSIFKVRPDMGFVSLIYVMDSYKKNNSDTLSISWLYNPGWVEVNRCRWLVCYCSGCLRAPLLPDQQRGERRGGGGQRVETDISATGRYAVSIPYICLSLWFLTSGGVKCYYFDSSP